MNTLFELSKQLKAEGRIEDAEIVELAACRLMILDAPDAVPPKIDTCEEVIPGSWLHTKAYF